MGPQGPAGEAGAPGEAGETMAAGSVMLVQSAGSCPKGWAEAGEAMLTVTSDFPQAPGQTESLQGILQPGMTNLNFYLCVKG
jgi:hypothetical protein